MNDDPRDFFPADYFAARAAFRLRAAAGQPTRHVIDARGPAGEDLTIDSAYVGAESPQRLVILTSGIHGVEGSAGSALQQLWLSDFAHRLPGDTGMLLVHALNPYGFAYGRRVNENNVDLNRNAVAEFPGPANPAYARLAAWLNPVSPVPRVDDVVWRGLPLLLRYGRAALVQAIAAGQYEFPRGLFYGGRERQPSLRIFSGLLAAPRLQAAREVWHFDLHSGLGRYGQHQLLLEASPASPEYARFAQWFGADAVRSDLAGDALYTAHGILPVLTRRAFPGARVHAATVEFGTYGPLTLLRRLRTENRLQHHGARHAADAPRIRQDLCEALSPLDPAWRAAVLSRGRQLWSQLAAALAAAPAPTGPG